MIMWDFQQLTVFLIIGLIMHEYFHIYEPGFVCAGLSLVKYASSLLVVMVASVLILNMCGASNDKSLI